jgi:hypothetical protein
MPMRGRVGKGAQDRARGESSSAPLPTLPLAEFAAASLRPRAQALNLQLRQKRDEGVRAHFHDRG